MTQFLADSHSKNKQGSKTEKQSNSEAQSKNDAFLKEKFLPSSPLSSVGGPKKAIIFFVGY